MSVRDRRPRLTRRGLLGMTGAAALAPVLSGCGDDAPSSASDGPIEQVTYLTVLGHTAREVYALVARELGFFEEVNLDVTIEPGEAGDANHAALTGGRVDFAGVDASGAMIRYANGEDTDFQVIGAIQQQWPMALLAYSDTGVSRPRDLNGRTIGLLAGSIAERMWPTYADLHPGLDPDTVEVIPTNPATQVQELVAGQLDAIALFVASAAGVQAAGGGREVTALPWSEVLPDLYGNVLTVRKPLVEENPDLVRRFVTALMRGLQYTIDNPQEAAELHHANFPEGNVEAHQREIELLTDYMVGGLEPGQPLGYIDQARVARAMGLLSAVGQIEQDFNQSLATPGADQADSVINFDFVPGGEERS